MNHFLQETLRTALAMGADRAVHVEVAGQEYEGLQPLAVAKILAKITQDEQVQLVILGKQVQKDTKRRSGHETNAGRAVVTKYF